MPPEKSAQTQEANSRVITKARVIAGLLGEVDAAGVLVLLNAAGREKCYASKLECEFKVPFETSVLRVMGEHFVPGLYHVSALFAGQRLSFDLHVIDGSGLCQLPSVIHITDLRASKRKKFGPTVDAAEISTKHGVFMATPVDMSQNSIAVLAPGNIITAKVGDDVRIVIRGGKSGKDLFSAKLRISGLFRDGAKNGGMTRILLSPKDPREDVSGVGPLRVSERHSSGGTGFILSPLDPALGGAVQSLVSDLSLTGFRCQIPEADALPWMMPGMDVHIDGVDVTATVVWRQNTSAGFRISGIEDSATFQRWAGLLRDYKIGHGFHASQADELVNLLTESGLLKGSRRKIYGSDPAQFLPPQKMLDNPLLYHRVLAESSSAALIGHISVVRLTEELWYFQEGAHIGGDGPTYKNLYQGSIKLARGLFQSSKINPRFLSGLYHANIKSAGEFGADLFADPSSRVYPFVQVSISKNTIPVRPEYTARDLVTMTAEERRDALLPFDATLVEAFAGGSGSHPRLNAELAKLGPHHNAQTLLIQKGQRVIAMAYRLRSYYALNTTGVMNSLWLIALPDVSGDDIKAAASLMTEQGLGFGTDDAAVIVSGPHSEGAKFEGEIAGARSFTFFIIDNYLNREFLGASTDLGEDRVKRGKHGK